MPKISKEFKCGRCYTTFTRLASLQRHHKNYSQYNRTCGSVGYNLPETRRKSNADTNKLDTVADCSNNYNIDLLPKIPSFVSKSSRIVKLKAVDPVKQMSVIPVVDVDIIRQLDADIPATGRFNL